MSRYIDVDKFKKYIKDGFEIAQPQFKTEQYRKLATEITMRFLEDIDDQPTADVVEVVRCKDCMWYNLYKNDYNRCHRINLTRGGEQFCSYGERREK